MYEDNVQYAARRLNGTVIQHKGRAIFVDGISENGEVKFTNTEGEYEYTHLSQLNHAPIPLGYCQNGNGKWAWVCRVPKRNDWRQGHHPNNIHAFYNINPKYHQELGLESFDFLLRGAYQPYHECLKNDGAFSRNYCFEKSKLYYKADPIADVQEGSVVFYDGFLHHKKRLERTYQYG